MLAHHLRRLRCIWTTCTLSLASQTRLERVHAVPGVRDAFGTLARHFWRPRCVWNACMPFLASQTRLEHLHAVFCVSECSHTVSGSSWTRLYCLNVIYGVSDAFITPERHSQRLGYVYNTRTPFSASRTCLRRLHAVTGISDTSVTPACRSQRLGRVCNVFTPPPGLGHVCRGYWSSYDSFVTNHYDSLLV
jgi:hypothetical protein